MPFIFILWFVTTLPYFSGWLSFFLWYYVQYHLGYQSDGIQFYFLLCVYAFDVICMRLTPLSGSNLTLYFLIRHIVLYVTFRFVMHWVFVFGAAKGPSLIPSHVDIHIRVVKPYLLKALSFLQWIILTPLLNIVTSAMW